MQKINFQNNSAPYINAINLNQLQTNIENEFTSMNPTYTTSRTITPSFNCIAEVILIFSGWSYGGEQEEVAITCTNNPTELARANTTLSGHDTTPDAGICMAVFEFEKDVTYELGRTGITGGNRGLNYITKLIPKN